jgi:hypothetical protein
MLSSMSLNGVWKVRGFDGRHGRPEHFFCDDADERTFISARHPVRGPLAGGQASTSS